MSSVAPSALASITAALTGNAIDVATSYVHRRVFGRQAVKNFRRVSTEDCGQCETIGSHLFSVCRVLSFGHIG